MLCENDISKVWYTTDTATAAYFSEIATEGALKHLNGSAQRQQETFQASYQTSAELELIKPAGLSYRPYQKAGIAFSLDRIKEGRRGVLIADEMGLGKTIQAIGIINNAPDIQTALIICPASLKLNWRNELNRWLVRNHSIGIADGPYYPNYTDIVIINYDILHRFPDELRARVWDLMIIDEAHYLGNKTSRRSKQVFGYKDLTPIQTRRVAMLTGTPFETRVKQIFPLIHYLDPATWPNEWEFLNRYYEKETDSFYVRGGGGKKKQATKFEKPKNLDDLQRRLRSSIMVRRMKKDVLTELPAKQRQIIEIPQGKLSGKLQMEIKAYQDWQKARRERKNLQELDESSYRARLSQLNEEIETAGAALATIRKELSIEKIPHIVDHVKDALEYEEKVIVFGYHRDLIEGVAAAFGSDAVMLYGGMSNTAKQNSIERFQNGDARLFVGSLMNAEGYTITSSSHMIISEYDWRPSKVLQAEDRGHRIGQLERLLIQSVIFEDSLDSKIAKRFIERQEEMEAALDMNTLESEEIEI